MMWFLGILWTCICFLCGFGWDAFVWFWNSPILFLGFHVVGLLFICVMFFKLIFGIFELIGMIFNSLFK